MDSLQHLLTRCLGELREWRAGAPDAARYPDELYAMIERTLRQLRRIGEPDEAARMVHEIELRIRDEGPISEAFLPSLEDLHEAVSGASVSRVPAGRVRA